MSSVYTPDLTGLDWDYYVSTYQRTIFRFPQKVHFDVPIYQNERLEVVKMGVIAEPLLLGVGFAIYEDDIDIDAISVCKNIDPTFDKILLKSITLINFTHENFKIQVNFNQLFADSINYARINQAREIEVTPDLVSNMVEQITYLQQMVLSTGGEYSEQSSTVKVALNEYPNGDNDDNLIVNEPHDIDTLNGKNLIRPIYGSFFRDSVSILKSLSNIPLVPEVDYIILDLDLSRTRTTANESGVYRVIKILKDIVGEVQVTYRAYGGVADVVSMRFVQDRVNVIEQHLARTSYITPNTLPADPTVISIRNKLQELEGNMRLLLQNGLPTYGDVSTGSALLKRIVAQDTGLHWWSISTLYRVEGSVDDILADVFRFRLKSLLSKLMFECVVTVNANPDSDERFTVQCINSNIPKDTLAKFVPKLRILEVSAGGIYSGVILQLGMKLGTGILQETFDIEDMSGRESCWKLVPFDANSTPPEDTGVLMPNGQMIFSYGEIPSTVNECHIPFTSGLHILNTVANLPLIIGDLNQMVFGTTENFDMVVQHINEIDFKKVKAFEITTVVNIGESDERELVLIAPLMFRDDVQKNWSSDTIEFVVEDTECMLDVTIMYSTADTAYKTSIRTSAKPSVGITLNVTAIKLTF